MANPPTVLSSFAQVRAGRTTARALVEDCLRAIDEVRSLNAFAAIQAEPAREQAALVDAEIAAGQSPGPLAGVPLGIKDNIDQAHLPSPAACRAYLDRIPARDATVVSRLVEAGAILLGRTNMHELANGVTCEDSCYGPVHNPWASGYHPGGSSGGSASAVAAGCLAAALGTDTGGSIRIPASLCGVVGFKPSAGLVPTDGVMPLSTSLDHVGPLTRTVRCAAVLTEVLAGAAAGELQAACEGPVAGLRLGSLSGFGLDPDPAVAERFDQACRLLTELGCALAPVRIDALAGSIRLLGRIYPPEAAAWHAPMLEARPEAFGPAVRADLERGRRQDPARREQALARSEALSLKIDAAMQNCDLLICPTTPHPTRSIGAPDPHTYLTYTCAFNLTGQPALSLPMGLAEGLPVGLQIIGRRGDDASVLRLAAAFEQRLGFVCQPETRAWE